jgi:hypothetical protein
MKQEQTNDSQAVTVTLLADGMVRVDYGDQTGGRYAIVDYSTVKDYVLSLKPRLELVELYGLAD